MRSKRVVLLLLALVFCLSGCRFIQTADAVMQVFSTPDEERDHRDNITEALEVDVTGGVEVYYENDHGGWLGDGLTFGIVEFPDDSLVSSLQSNFGWNELPLSENLEIALYGRAGEYSALIRNDGEEALFPKVENGYYYFLNRCSNGLGPGGRYDDSILFDNYSFNFTAAIYDTDTNTLYYTLFDT